MPATYNGTATSTFAYAATMTNRLRTLDAHDRVPFAAYVARPGKRSRAVNLTPPVTGSPAARSAVAEANA